MYAEGLMMKLVESCYFGKFIRNLSSRSLSSRLSTIGDFAAYMKSGKAKNVVVLIGAGISTPCGIPDFRSKGTGIYDNLQKYNLPYPEAVFELDYFMENPLPYYQLRKSLIETVLKVRPSIAHYFIKLLYDKNILLKVCTQNIDDLEHKTGLPREFICQAHGNLQRAFCMKCGKEGNIVEILELIEKNEIPHCSVCHGLMKPNTVLFGENLPENFYDFLREDLPRCDLLIILGTSLQVYPVSSVPFQLFPRGTPRLLINKQICNGFSFLKTHTNEQIINDIEDVDLEQANDIFFEGSCDDGCSLLAKYLGWKKQLDDLSLPKVS